MDHQFASSMPFDSANNDPDQPAPWLPTVHYEGLHTTQTFDTMPALTDSIDHVLPGHPISAHTYSSVPGMIQQGPAMQQVLLSNSDNGYHNHLQQIFIPNTGPRV